MGNSEKKSVEMRAVFGNTLAHLMEQDPRILLVDADLARANGTLSFKEKFKDRAFNVGIQEANMVCFAAGLASYDFIPVISTFAPFATRRIFDQVTISVSYANSNVKIIGSDPGVAAEINGGTHMSFEDAGLMRTLPNMVIFEPCDNLQFEKALPKIIEYKGPVYVRMFRKVCPDIFSEDYQFDLFKADKLRDGKDVTLFASGVLMKPALDAAVTLSEKGISAEVINIHTWKPIDKEAILESVKKTGCAVTCENHNIINGLGSAVSDVTSENYPVPVLRVGVQDRFGVVGKLDYLMEKLNLTAGDIVAKAEEVIRLKESFRGRS